MKHRSLVGGIFAIDFPGHVFDMISMIIGAVLCLRGVKTVGLETLKVSAFVLCPIVG